MAKIKSVFFCNECGYKTPKWVGKCPECHTWNSLSEEIEVKSKKQSLVIPDIDDRPKTISEIEVETTDRATTGVFEFDRVVGGGLVKGSLVLIGGEPGIGKSTLLLDVCTKIANGLEDGVVLYVSGEESKGQVAGRAKRMGVSEKNFYILNETRWEKIFAAIQKLKPTYLVIDSIQTTISEQLQSPPGTVSQIREVTYQLMNFCKSTETTCLVIGHVTKEGSIAGPKILEHMVDTVVYFEGDQLNQYRILRVIKNRFGNANEVGIFEMRENGLKEVTNPSELFIETPLKGAFGRCITSILEGSRSLFIEIQALVVENKFGNGRRTTHGIDNNRLSMLVAVIEKYFEIPLSFSDIYLNVVGGIKLSTRESDLAIVAAILSSYYQRPISERILFLGEVGLTGEIRSIPFFEKRLKEASHMSYEKIVTAKKVVTEFQDQAKIKLVGLEQSSQLKKLFFE